MSDVRREGQPGPAGRLRDAIARAVAKLDHEYQLQDPAGFRRGDRWAEADALREIPHDLDADSEVVLQLVIAVSFAQETSENRAVPDAVRRSARVTLAMIGSMRLGLDSDEMFDRVVIASNDEEQE